MLSSLWKKEVRIKWIFLSWGDKILALLEMVFGFWNNQVSLVFSMLGQSPVNFKGGGPWQVIESIEPIFVGVGSSLVVLFFVIGFCSESVDVREEMRFEVILRMLIRLGLAFTQSASMDTEQFANSMNFIRENAAGATVHDGLFVRASDTAGIYDYLVGNQLIK